MPGSKYEREIRFIGRETARLGEKIREIESGRGSGSAEEDAVAITEMKRKIEELSSRRKEIEDSYIAAGLELPLESRNLNASVYRIGSSFEPVGNDYRLAIMDEVQAEQAVHTSAGGVDCRDHDALMSELTLVSDRINVLERDITDADLADDLVEKARLEEKVGAMRARKDELLLMIKRSRAERKEPVAEVHDADGDRRLASLEKECGSLNVRINALRDDIGDIKESLQLIMDTLHID